MEEAGNLLAVGSMSPQIEVWDLDIIDAVEPAFVLGDKKVSKKKKKATSGHRAEVMSLSWNRLQRNVLASGSADQTVRLWDLATKSCLRTFGHHNGKVQAVVWNPKEAAVLLTGSYDHTAAVFDTRRAEVSFFSQKKIPTVTKRCCSLHCRTCRGGASRRTSSA